MSPNEALLAQDAARLGAWRQWLARLARRSASAATASPCCGRWQLSFDVHNFAPALQKVIVEQQGSDGTWRTLAARFTIEFRAAAARPRAWLRQPFSVPADDPDAPLRLAVRGLGQVAVGNITLTDGMEVRRPKSGRRRIILGRRAPTHGWPEFSLEQNAGEHVLVWG
jgi:hypothetical protein